MNAMVTPTTLLTRRRIRVEFARFDELTLDDAITLTSDLGKHCLGILPTSVLSKSYSPRPLYQIARKAPSFR